MKDKLYTIATVVLLIALITLVIWFFTTEPYIQGLLLGARGILAIAGIGCLMIADV